MEGESVLNNPAAKGAIQIGVAEWKAAKDPGILRTTLGSCVAAVLYSPELKAGGISHILLGEAPQGRIVNRGKYARTSVFALLEDLKKMEVPPEKLKARIFGGASMFNAKNSPFLQRIGEENISSVKKVLDELKIEIIHEDTGGHSGRHLIFYLDDGRIFYSANGKEKYIYKV